MGVVESLKNKNGEILFLSYAALGDGKKIILHF